MKKIKVKVMPKSGRQEIAKISDDEYKVHLKKSPEDNKANKELEKLLTKHFGVSATIKRGFTSKNKIVELNNGD